MTIEFENPTTSKLTDVEILSQKNRAPDANPGAKLTLSTDLANDVLAHFDGFLKSFLFTKNGPSEAPAQDSIETVEPVSDLPNLSKIGEKVGALHWDQELTGYDMEIDYGIGDKSNLKLSDCKLDGFVITPKEGGTVTLKFVVECEDVPEKVFGKLATLKAREVKILLTAPEVVQEEIE